MVARMAHNHKVVCSIHTPATNIPQQRNGSATDFGSVCLSPILSWGTNKEIMNTTKKAINAIKLAFQKGYRVTNNGDILIIHNR